MAKKKRPAAKDLIHKVNRPVGRPERILLACSPETERLIVKMMIEAGLTRLDWDEVTCPKCLRIKKEVWA